MQKVLQLDQRDNVLIALTDLRQGEEVQFNGTKYSLATPVNAKHKFAITDLAQGAEVIMYGVLVGKTYEPVKRGEALTLRNLRHESSEYHQKSSAYEWKAPDISRWRERKFKGYRRSDGQVGTRNHWIVVPLVFCENRNILNLKQAFEEELGFAAPQEYRQQVAELAKAYRKGNSGETKSAAMPDKSKTPQKLFPNVDGIRFLLHEGGCGGTHEDSNNLCGLIAGYINHPNVAGATVLSLGCQHAQVEILQEQINRRNPNLGKPVLVFEQQKSGSEYSMLSSAISATFEGLVEANKAHREPAELKHLCVGLKCGGSDGFSGLSANPAIGHTSDLLAALRARTILSEFPELCGVEQDLINRSVTGEVGSRFMELMREYESRARAVRSSFAMNPAPGNMRDGLLTDAMKSAGAAKKGGTSPVTAVLDYPEYSREPGLNLLCTPGNDVECVTGQVGAGANIVLFTTGLGTPAGNPITPVIKLSTNKALAQRMPDIIDIDTGAIITGETSIEQMGEAILDRVIQAASGEVRTKAEEKNQEDFIPWKRGVSL